MLQYLKFYAKSYLLSRTYDNRKPPSTAPAPISGSVGCNIVRSSQADMEKYRGRPPLEGIVAGEKIY